MTESMIKDVVTVRHVVSLAGVVQEQAEEQDGGAANRPLRQAILRRIAGAHVRILTFAAPLDFQSRVLARLEAQFANSFSAAIDDLVALLDTGQLPDLLRTQFLDHHQSLSQRAFCAPIEAQSTWRIVDGGKAYEIWRLNDKLHVYFNPRPENWSRRQPRQRIDQTWSQADGIFFFVDLPTGNPGESYRLRVSMPNMGTRCKTAETEPIQVHANPEGQPVQTVWAPITLAPTRIRGTAKYREGAKNMQWQAPRCLCVEKRPTC